MEIVDHSKVVAHDRAKMRTRFLRVGPAVSISAKSVICERASQIRFARIRETGRTLTDRLFASDRERCRELVRGENVLHRSAHEQAGIDKISARTKG